MLPYIEIFDIHIKFHTEFVGMFIISSTPSFTSLSPMVHQLLLPNKKMNIILEHLGKCNIKELAHFSKIYYHTGLKDSAFNTVSTYDTSEL
jgi:hypothetical protein